MLELHIEALFEFGRKRTHRRIARLDILVANGTHRPVFVGDRRTRELAHVATDTRFVAGEFQFSLFPFSPMTRNTLKLLMLSDQMRKLVKIGIGCFYCDRLRPFRGSRCHWCTCRLLDTARDKHNRADEQDGKF